MILAKLKQIPQWIQIIIVMVFSILLIIPALYNGYPLTFHDSQYYLYYGYLEVLPLPIHRPMAYCLFVKNLSFSYSLWFIVITQALIVTYLILMLARYMWKDSWFVKSMLLIISVAFFSGVSNFISQIMPDIFTSVMLLSIVLFILYFDKSWMVTCIMAILILFSVILHFSNLLTSTVLVILLFVIRIFWSKSIFTFKKILWLTLIILVGWVIIPTLNYVYGGAFTMSRAGNVFFTGRLIETGIVSEYLHDNCGKKNIPLCKYYKELAITSDSFLWRTSPLYDDKPKNSVNFDTVWFKKNIEYAPMIKDILTTPKYLIKVAYTSVVAAIKQIGNVSVTELPSYVDAKYIMAAVLLLCPNETQQCKNSRQAYATQHFHLQSATQKGFFWLSIIGILVILIFRKYRKHLTKNHALLLLVNLIGIIINAWVCTTFSTNVERYQARVAWLVLLSFSVLVIYFWDQKNEKKLLF